MRLLARWSPLLLGVLTLSTAAVAGERPVAASPGEVSPLLIGAEVPPAQVRDAGGEALDLAELVRGKPSLILFYRGGW